jgi:nucleoside-diphosphate-sugar epimerase
LLQRACAADQQGSLEVYSVDHTRTFCFVDDAVEMVLRLAVAGRALGKAVNVGVQEPEISIGRLAEVVIATVAKRLTILPLAPTEGSPRRRAPDMSLCLSLTGYRGRTSIEEGVQRTYDWYRGHASALQPAHR